MCYENDTIVAVATASGVGAISIVRLSGSSALHIAKKITKKNSFVPRMATLSKLFDIEDILIDEGIVIFFENPFSFTGEDIVEFQSHGGMVLTHILVETLIAYGARPATAGEFSKRAYLNGKIDLTQAYAISKLIEAKSKEGVRLLAKQLKGELKVFIEEIRSDLLMILAHIEVSIDYAEEDLPSDIVIQIAQKLEKIETKLENALRSSHRRDGMIDGFKVAIVGKPNVGKSSLLNRLLDYDRAIVSNIAGTTRDTIEEGITIGTHMVTIVDTAGIRQTNEIVEQIGIERSLQASEEADIVIALFDNSEPFEENDQKIITLLEASEKEKIVVLNKCDLPDRFPREKLPYIDCEIIVSKNKSIEKPLDPLIKKIQEILDQRVAGTDGIAFVSKVQIMHLSNGLDAIRVCKKLLRSNDLEFFAYHTTEALEHIAHISRPYEHTEMLDVMFGTFCLGK